MNNFEKVEKLRTKANVSYEEAKAALEANDWDLLDAIVYLENAGKTYDDPAPDFSTKQKKRKSRPIEEPKEGVFKRILNIIRRLIDKGNKILFRIHRNGKQLIELPLTAVIILLLLLGWGLPFILLLMIIGLFFGFRYSFDGEGVYNGVNRVMDKAADKAVSLKHEIMSDDPAADETSGDDSAE